MSYIWSGSPHAAILQYAGVRRSGRVSHRYEVVATASGAVLATFAQPDAALAHAAALNAGAEQARQETRRENDALWAGRP